MNMIDEGDIALPRAKYERVATSSMHDAEQQSKKYSKSSHAREEQSTSLSLRAYFVFGYQILLHLSLLYCVVGVTYLLCTNGNEAYKQQETVLCDCTLPTPQPSKPVDSVGCSCANEQTETPSFSQASMTPTKIPVSSEYQSINPTQGPTVRPSSPESAVVGDYKLSARNESHGAWLLCDGSFLNAIEYSQLFEVLGHSFGSFSKYPSLFALPNAMDKVIGVSGEKHAFGEVIGNETISLNASQLPKHSHFVANTACQNHPQYTTYTYLSRNWCGINHNWGYSFLSTPGEPNIYPTSQSGENSKISIIQPSIFLGNLFVYSG